MKKKNYFVLSMVVAAVIWMAAGCAPARVIKSTDSAAREKMVEVSDEEYAVWADMAKNGKDSVERSKGAFWSGQYYFNKKNYSEAAKYFTFNEKYYSDVDWGYLSILRLFDISVEQKDSTAAVERLKVLLEKRLQFAQFEDVAIKRLEGYLSTMTRDELKALYHLHKNQLIDEYDLYFLSKADLQEGDNDAFFQHANAFLADYRDSKFYPEITGLYRDLLKYKPVNARKIGVIIPLSGKSMDIGSIVKSGVELALAGYNATVKPEEKISLIYMDEESSKLEEDLARAVETDGIIAVIGPLYSKTVKTLMPFIDKYTLPLCSPTAAQPDLVGKTKYFFRNCGTARGQAYAAAKYMYEDTGDRNVAVLYSDNAFGKSMNDYFTEKFKALGGTVPAQVSYDPKISDFQEQVVQLGGVNTILLKEKRADEKMKLDRTAEDTAKMMMAKVFDYLNIIPPDENAMPKPTPDPKMRKISVAVLHMSPHGESVRKYKISDDMTKKISYTMAKSSIINVIKQKVTDDTMASLGVEAEDLDRDLAFNIASKVGADILIWGKIIEEKTDTLTANFMPEATLDSKGNAKITYKFTDRDYFRYTVRIYAVAVADEAVIDEVVFEYRKVKEPATNPIGLDALYIPATDRKMVLICDQLRFYDFDLPVFGTSALDSPYLNAFRESVEGVVYTVDFCAEDPDPVTAGFVSKYRERYASSPDAIAAASYDIMSMVCSVLRSKVTSREALRESLAAIRDYPGVSGLFSFDDTGDSVKQYGIMKMGKTGPQIIKKITGE
ncbi:MAG: penicillin-binding protein activator [Spirochaetia bacterium]|nr:penicillin-binding protein activator [Spirochaetia bacterium]